MSNELKDKLDKSLDAIEELEDKIEDYVDDLEDDVEELWVDIKDRFAGMTAKLKGATKNLEAGGDEVQLQAHLGTMEAHDKFDAMKDAVEDFTNKVSAKAHTELDTVGLRAHLAKMDAEDYWEEKSKTLTKDFHQSSGKVKDASLNAANDMKDYFEKLIIALTKSA